MAEMTLKEYLILNLKNFDSQILENKYVKQVAGSGLISDTDLAKIASNETAISTLSTFIGALPDDATATTVVAYIQEAMEAAKDAATYVDDTEIQAAITKLNGGSEVEGSVDNKVALAVASIVANAPTAYDTLKEIADWITSDVDGAAAMNSAIVTLKGLVGETSVASQIVTATGVLKDKDGNTVSVKDYVDNAVQVAKTEATKGQITTSDLVSIDFATEW